jgi:hypothetical protein
MFGGEKKFFRFYLSGSFSFEWAIFNLGHRITGKESLLRDGSLLRDESMSRDGSLLRDESLMRVHRTLDLFF